MCWSPDPAAAASQRRWAHSLRTVDVTIRVERRPSVIFIHFPNMRFENKNESNPLLRIPKRYICMVIMEISQSRAGNQVVPTVTSPRGDVTYSQIALTARLLRQCPRALTATQTVISQGRYFKYSSAVRFAHSYLHRVVSGFLVF